VRNWPKAKLRKFEENLFQPVDALPFGIFRFLFGFLLCIEFFVVSRESFPEYYIKPLFHFTYPLFDLLGLKPLSQPSLWLIFDAMRISTVGIMLGLLTRLCLIVFTSAFGYFFFMESSVYSNHYYLIFLLSFLMCFGHSGSAFSFDSLISKRSRRKQVDYWELFLLRFQICVVFFFGAMAKLNADWLIHAAPLYLNLIKHFSFLGYPLHEKWMAVVLSWGGMLTDLGLGILLAIDRCPKLAFIWLCLFNGMNVFLFGLGIKTFPYLMVSSYILFLPTPIVRESIARFINGNFFKNVSRLDKNITKRTVSNERAHRKEGSPWILGFAIVYTSLQILIPLRHLLYKRDLQWTHEGIDFSWRMMADHHETDGSLTIEDPQTKDVYLHSPETLLSHKQLVMVNNPYMLVQYIQFLKEFLKQHTDIKNPIIRADIQVSLNGRPFQYMYDPTCNLSEVTYSPFKDLKWIIPLKKP
jgi:hypothetical protein